MLRFVGLCLVVLMMGITGCVQIPHATPEAALTEFPGFLQAGDKHVLGTEQILHRIPVDGGVVLIYRWQDKANAGKATHCVGATQVKEVLGGWRAESSTAPDFTCDYNLQQEFIISSITIDGRKLVYGLHPNAHRAEVTWTDSELSSALIEQGIFMVIHDSTEVGLAEVTVFDAAGVALPSEYRDGNN